MNEELYHYGVKGMKWGVRRSYESTGSGPVVKKKYKVSSDDVKKYAKSTANFYLRGNIKKNPTYSKSDFSRNLRKDFERELVKNLAGKGYESNDRKLTKKVRKFENASLSKPERKKAEQIQKRNDRIDRAVEKNEKLAREWRKYGNDNKYKGNKKEYEVGRRAEKYLLNNNKKLFDLRKTDIEMGRKEIENWRKYGNPVG